MTRYTVLWDEEVEARFINAWIAADPHTRAMLTQIATWVDKNLANDPDQKGQLQPNLGVRVVTVPLSNSAARVSVAYQILPDDRQVRVVRLVFRGA